MDVLKQKFGRKPLQYKPEELDADNISDEEYQVLNSEGGETYDAGKLEAKLEYLVNDYYSKSLKKDPAKLSLEKKQKAIKWIDHLSIQDMSIELTPEDLQNDFKRELVFYEIALENAKKALDKLKEMGMSI